MCVQVVHAQIFEIYKDTILFAGKQKEIEKIFSNCEERLRIYQQELEEADKEEM